MLEDSQAQLKPTESNPGAKQHSGLNSLLVMLSLTTSLKNCTLKMAALDNGHASAPYDLSLFLNHLPKPAMHPCESLEGVKFITVTGPPLNEETLDCFATGVTHRILFIL